MGSQCLFHTLFTLRDGTNGALMVVRLPDGGRRVYTVAFARSNTSGVPTDFGLAGDHRAFEVLPTVVCLLTEWVSKVQPDELRFAALEGNRQKLYRRIVARLAADQGYVATEELPYAGVSFILRRRLAD